MKIELTNITGTYRLSFGAVSIDLDRDEFRDLSALLFDTWGIDTEKALTPSQLLFLNTRQVFEQLNSETN